MIGGGGGAGLNYSWGWVIPGHLYLCVYINYTSLQDLNGLNRSLNRVIVVDTNKDAVKLHPENAIILDKWNGDITDRTLWDLISFLQSKLPLTIGVLI